MQYVKLDVDGLIAYQEIDNGAVVADGPRDQVLSAMKSGQINF